MLCVVSSPTIQSYHPLQYYHMFVETSLSLCQVIIPPGLSIPIHLIYLSSTNFLPQITLGEDRSYTSHADNRGEECRTLRLHHKIPSHYGSRISHWSFYILSDDMWFNRHWNPRTCKPEVALQSHRYTCNDWIVWHAWSWENRTEVNAHNFPF